MTHTEYQGNVHLPGAEQTDAELVSSYRSGDETAAKRLYELYSLDALRYSRSAAPNVEVADEFTSEAFTRVFEAIRRGNGPTGSFKHYLITVVRNLSADYYRDSSRLVDVENIGKIVDSNPLIDTEGLSLEVGESEIITAFQRLPERWRQIIFVRDIEGRSIIDSAAMFGLTPNGTTMLYSRAKDGLRKEYVKELASIALASAAPSCAAFADDLALFAMGAPATKRRAPLLQHLTSCDSCGRTAENLQLISSRFTPRGVTAALTVVAGSLILPTLGKLSAGSSVTSLGTLFGSKTLIGLPVLVTIGTAGVIAGGVALADIGTGAPEQTKLAVATSAGTCVATIDHGDRNGIRGTITATNEAGAECTITYAVNDTVVVERAAMTSDEVFAASRPGRYTVTIETPTQSKSVSFSIQ